MKKKQILYYRLRKAFKCLIVKKSFDYSVLFFIALNCITLAMERPSIPSISLVGFC
jgi:voltage-dependent calcium channel T type alpha-1G